KFLRTFSERRFETGVYLGGRFQTASPWHSSTRTLQPAHPPNNTCGAPSPIYHSLSARARVVKWQTRTFEGRMPQGMGVQVPPRAHRGFAAESPTSKSQCPLTADTRLARLKLHLPAHAHEPSHDLACRITSR